MKNLRPLFTPLVIVLLLGTGASAHLAREASHAANSQNDVRAELEQLEKSNGYSLLAVKANKIYAANFANRSLSEQSTFFPLASAVSWGVISPDGLQIAFAFQRSPDLAGPAFVRCPASRMCLAISNVDGTDFRIVPNITEPFGTCWSRDGSKLVIGASNTKLSDDAFPILQIVDSKSGNAEEIDGSDSHATSQCWSADDSQIAYTHDEDRGIRLFRIYDLRTHRSRDVAEGAYPTWSPDGEWIAFLDCPVTLHDCAYDLVDPSGNHRRRLLTSEIGPTPLWWSPDGQFVAYVNGVSDSEDQAGLKDGEVYRLRIRRFSDGAEDWVLNLSENDWLTFQWVLLPSR